MGYGEPCFQESNPSQPRACEPMTSIVFEIEGKELHAVQIGHTDTSSTTVLHVPSIGLEVAGDAYHRKKEGGLWAHDVAISHMPMKAGSPMARPVTQAVGRRAEY
ncbi:hypothetical protein BDW75DRAFT_226351 [Aspergillus navahoensis]